MNALSLIAKAKDVGITLIREPDGRLTAEGPTPAIKELWPEIRQMKAAVLALLPASAAPDVVGLVGDGGLLSTDPNSTDDESDLTPAPATDTPRHEWRVTMPSGECFTSSCTPPATLAEMRGWYPDADIQPEPEGLEVAA